MWWQKSKSMKMKVWTMPFVGLSGNAPNPVFCPKFASASIMSRPAFVGKRKRKLTERKQSGIVVK